MNKKGGKKEGRKGRRQKKNPFLSRLFFPRDLHRQITSLSFSNSLPHTQTQGHRFQDESGERTHSSGNKARERLREKREKTGPVFRPSLKNRGSRWGKFTFFEFFARSTQHLFNPPSSASRADGRSLKRKNTQHRASSDILLGAPTLRVTPKDGPGGPRRATQCRRSDDVDSS